MIDPEEKLAELECQWRDADELLETARAELAASLKDHAADIATIRKRVLRAERIKQAIAIKIMSLEKDMDAASFG
jgi:hypothetical protein